MPRRFKLTNADMTTACGAGADIMKFHTSAAILSCLEDGVLPYTVGVRPLQWKSDIRLPNQSSICRSKVR